MWKIENTAVLLILVVLSGIDIKKRKLSVRVMAALTLAVLLYRMVYREYDIRQYAWGLVPGALLLGISFITRQALGYGDSWMILILGVCLGITDVIRMLMTAFSLAAVFSMVCLAWEYMKGQDTAYGRKSMGNMKKREFAFLPMLALSYLGTVLL